MNEIPAEYAKDDGYYLAVLNHEMPDRPRIHGQEPSTPAEVLEAILLAYFNPRNQSGLYTPSVIFDLNYIDYIGTALAYANNSLLQSAQEIPHDPSEFTFDAAEVREVMTEAIKRIFHPAPPTDADRIAALTAEVERLTRESKTRRLNIISLEMMLNDKVGRLFMANARISQLTVDNQRLTDTLAAIGARLMEGAKAAAALSDLPTPERIVSAHGDGADQVVYAAAHRAVSHAPDILALIADIQALAGVDHG